MLLLDHLGRKSDSEEPDIQRRPLRPVVLAAVNARPGAGSGLAIVQVGGPDRPADRSAVREEAEDPAGVNKQQVAGQVQLTVAQGAVAGIERLAGVDRVQQQTGPPAEAGNKIQLGVRRPIIPGAPGVDQVDVLRPDGYAELEPRGSPGPTSRDGLTWSRSRWLQPEGLGLRLDR